MEKKLAHQLRDVTEATPRLYGNDLQIAERLLSRLLTFETQQSGFGLTATQDAHFNEVGDTMQFSFIHTCLICNMLSLCFTLTFNWTRESWETRVGTGGGINEDMFAINKACSLAVVIHNTG